MRKPKPIYELVRVQVGWELECQHCGQAFEAKRSDARYCSDDCRAAAHYDRTRRKK